MSFVDRLLRSFGELPTAAWLVPVIVLILYLIISRSLRNRSESAWVPTLVLLLDAIIMPAFFYTLNFLVVSSAGAFAGIDTLSRAIWSLFWLSVAWITNRMLRRFLWRRYFIRQYGREAPRILQHIVATALYVAALGVLLVLVFERPASGVLVSTGVLVGVVGLALQNILSDLFSGVSLTLERHFTVGDWIELPDGTLGEVTDISWQAIHLRSLNSARVIIPNAHAARSVIHNYSKPTKAHAIWLTVKVDAAHDPGTVRQLLLEAALSCAAVKQNPAPVVNLSNGSGNPYEYVVYVYFKDYGAHFAGRNDLYMNIHTYLTRAGIGTAADTFEVATRGAPERVLELPTVRDELRRAELFSILTDEQIDRLADEAIDHTYFPEDVIVEEGTRGGSLFIITSGAVQVTKRSPKDADIEVTRLGSGEVIGEMSLLTGEPRSATVVALVQTSVIEVTKDNLTPILKEVPELTDRFAEVMLDRRLENEQFLENMRRSDKANSDFLSDYLERTVRRMRR
ncbi:MAG: cyclic nucleotide-binding domain-containing protein, partial [Alkalispirochaetaceae bacterium]